MTEQVEPDVVNLELVRGALRFAQSEMESLIERTSMSPFINEKKDYMAMFADAAGRALTLSNPTGAPMLDCVLERFPADSMLPGDMYWYNDCYLSRGAISHSPDMVFICPAFHEGQLVGFSEGFGHFWDIGGMRPGSLSADATEIFQEGIMIPPVRIMRGGEWAEDIVRIFTRNSRFPEMMHGDIRSFTAAVRLGEARLVEMASRFGGAASLNHLFDVLIQMTRDRIRSRMLEIIPEGSYRFVDDVDTDQGRGPGSQVSLVLTRSGDQLALDTTGSDNQTVGPFNLLMHESLPNLMLAMQLTAHDDALTMNAGAADILDEVRVRPGSILAPRFPAPLGSRSHTYFRVNAALQGILALATGGLVPAASSTYGLYTVRAFDTDSHSWVLWTDGLAVGHGGRPHADGLDAVYYIGQKNFPIEYLEQHFPIRMNEYSIRLDSGGPGRYRGGCGVVRDFTFLGPDGTLACRLDNVRFPSWGVNGGRNGRPGSVMHVRAGSSDALAPVSDGTMLRTGDRVRIETSGGGGWGHPFDRPPDEVSVDVRSGVVSVEAAERDYGVVLDEQGGVDAARTERRRRSRPDIRMFHRLSYVDSFDRV